MLTELELQEILGRAKARRPNSLYSRDVPALLDTITELKKQLKEAEKDLEKGLIIAHLQGADDSKKQLAVYKRALGLAVNKYAEDREWSYYKGYGGMEAGIKAEIEESLKQAEKELGG